jgi:hypothetical protein
MLCRHRTRWVSAAAGDVWCVVRLAICTAIATSVLCQTVTSWVRAFLSGIHGRKLLARSMPAQRLSNNFSRRRVQLGLSVRQFQLVLRLVETISNSTMQTRLAPRAEPVIGDAVRGLYPINPAS